MNNTDLQAENAKLRELLGLAVEDIENIKVAELCARYPHCLGKAIAEGKKKLNCQSCQCWDWQHSDKLQELGILQDEI